jgi:spermidine/putrescine transport system substrate-binding protein
VAAAALAACAPPPPPAGRQAWNLKLPTDMSLRHREDGRWANWTAYLDVRRGDQEVPDVLRPSSSETGIQATYSEDIDDNDSYVSKIRPQLAGGQDIGRDIIT